MPVKRLPIESWPAGDRRLWRRASAPSSLLDEGGAAAGWRPATIRLTVDAYSAWLAWLDGRGELSANEGQLARLTRPRIQAYVEHLSSELADTSVALQLHHLHGIVRVMTGEASGIAWLDKLSQRLLRHAKPARPKAPRLVGSNVLYALGRRLIESAETNGATILQDDAILYRDGLMIAMLAARPLRRGELLALRIDASLHKENGRYIARLAPDLTKTKRARDVAYPPDLTAAIDLYLDRVRPVLARSPAPGAIKCNAFWLSRLGRPIDAGYVSHRIRRLTLEHLDRDLCPHLFRDCAATSIAINDPAHIGIVKDVLGHTTLRTSERHYNQAGAISAARRLQALVSALRDAP